MITTLKVHGRSASVSHLGKHPLPYPDKPPEGIRRGTLIRWPRMWTRGAGGWLDSERGALNRRTGRAAPEGRRAMQSGQVRALLTGQSLSGDR